MTAYLALSAAVSGALVMVVEIMGSRVIGPFFGASLFVWTSLITVTLVALGLGYAAGGFLADRRGTPDVLYGFLLLAGCAALLIPVLRAPVIRSCAPHGLRFGALLASLELFFPSLFLLGCTSPFFVRIATRELGRLGRTVGLFYAASTLGSVVGSIATGFFLIERLGVRGVFVLVGGGLILLAVVYALVFRRLFAAAALLLLPLLVPSEGAAGARVVSSSGRVERLLKREGFYGTLQVLEYRYGDARVRDLVLDGLAQSGMDVESGLSVYDYVYFLEFLPYGMNPDGRSCLAIGLGAGLVPRWYEAQGIRTDVIELNPAVLAVAREYFAFRGERGVALGDARRVLGEPGPLYDYVIVDAFSGDAAPGQLFTREALTLVRGRLNPRGIVAINLIGGVGEDALAIASVVRTAERVFERVLVYPVFDPEEPGGLGNVILIAQTGAPLAFDPARLAGQQVHAFARAGIRRFLGRPFDMKAKRRGFVLTDDFNPLDALELWSKEDLRRRILAAVPWDMLL